MKVEKREHATAHQAMHAQTVFMPLVDRFIDDVGRGGIRFEKVSAILGEDLLVTIEAAGGHRMTVSIMPPSQSGCRYKHQIMVVANAAPDGYYDSMLIKRAGGSMACIERAAKDLLAVWQGRMDNYQRRVKAAAALEANGFIGQQGHYGLYCGRMTMNNDGSLNVEFWQRMPVERVLRALGMDNTYLDDDEDEEAA